MSDPLDGAELARQWAARVSAMVAGVEARIFYILADTISAGQGAPRHAVDVLARAGVTRARLERELGGDWQKILDEVQTALDQARQAGQGQAEKEIHRVFHNPAPLLAPALNNAVSLVALDTLTSLTGLKALILRDAADIYRSVMEQAVVNTVFGAVTPKTAMSDTLAAFAARGITSFEDKSGRFWRIDSYAEMAVRTGAMNAYREGHAQHLAAYGMDLVFVHGHGYTCPKCAPWEGKVLSLGATPPGTAYVQHATRPRIIPVAVAATVAQATEAGLFHPNCGHSLSAYFPGVSTLTTSGPGGNPETYKASQKQRALERGIRQSKRELAAALDPETVAEKRAEINEQRRRIRELLAEQPKLKRKPERESERKPTGIRHSPITTIAKPNVAQQAHNTKPKTLDELRTQAVRSYSGPRGEITQDDGAKPKPHEKVTAARLSAHGIDVHFRKEINVEGVKNPDADIFGDQWEFKSPKGNGKNTIDNQFKEAQEQAQNLVLDLVRTELPLETVINAAQHSFDRRKRIQRVIIISRDNELIFLG